VGVEIILHEHDLFGLGKMDIAQLFEDLRIIMAVRRSVSLTSRQPSSGANSMNRLAVPLRSYS
jgi:hypothetical protein